MNRASFVYREAECDDVDVIAALATGDCLINDYDEIACGVVRVLAARDVEARVGECLDVSNMDYLEND